jgi:hypothetical protein
MGAMNNKALLLSSVTLAIGLLAGCKSNQESAGDKFRKAGDPINGLMQYEEALRRGKVSADFWPNYTTVNIQAMALRYQEDPNAEFLDILKDTVVSLLSQHPNPQSEALFAQTLYDVGVARINSGGSRQIEGGLKFLTEANALANKPADLAAKIDAATQAAVSNALKEVKDEMDGGEETSGIVADYKMNELLLKIGKATPEMAALWSEIRKKNLSQYLMYDLEGLLPEVDARINKYALLLGIVKYDHSGSSVKIQAKLFNGSSIPLTFNGKGIQLFDKDGKAYAPTTMLGAVTKKDIVGAKDESKTGGVNFTLAAGAEPDYLEFTTEGLTTRKYLP